MRLLLCNDGKNQAFRSPDAASGAGISVCMV